MGSKVKVVHLIESLVRGGAERLLCTNLAHLDRSRFDNVVVYLFKPDLLRAEIEALSIPCIGLDLKGPWDWHGCLWKLRQQLKALAPDLIHTNLVKADIYGRIVGRSLGIPVISTIHESPYYPEVFLDNPDLNRVKYSLIKLVDRLTAQHCVKTFVVVSNFSGNAAREYLGVSPSRTWLIYNSLDLEQFESVPADNVEALRLKLGISPEEKVLVNVGRLAPQKGQRYLLMALRMVLTKDPNVRLVIRGDGPIREILQAMGLELGIASKVSFVDPVPKISWLLGLSDIFVFPSLHEGLGIALLEAMAMGKPCVASEVGPIPEVVEHGRSGLLVRPRDPDDLARAILALLDQEDLRREMGERGRQIVKEKFDIRQNVRALEKVYIEGLSPARALAGV